MAARFSARQEWQHFGGEVAGVPGHRFTSFRAAALIVVHAGRAPASHPW
jgi:hypothetical protein